MKKFVSSCYSKRKTKEDTIRALNILHNSRSSQEFFQCLSSEEKNRIDQELKQLFTQANELNIKINSSGKIENVMILRHDDVIPKNCRFQKQYSTFRDRGKTTFHLWSKESNEELSELAKVDNNDLIYIVDAMTYDQGFLAFGDAYKCLL